MGSFRWGRRALEMIWLHGRLNLWGGSIQLCLAAHVAQQRAKCRREQNEVPPLNGSRRSSRRNPPVAAQRLGMACTRRFILRLGVGLAFAIAVGGLPTLQAAAATTQLSPDAIKATFGTGVPFSSTSPSGARYTLVLKPDGTATRAPKQSKAPTPGKWRLSKDGY